MKDEKLKTLVREGQRKKAFLLIYECFPAVKRTVRQAGGSGEDAEDIFQDVVISLYKRMKENNFFPEKSLSVYLQTAAKNLYFRKINRDIRERESMQTVFEEAGDLQQTEDDLMELAGEKALAEVGGRCAELLDNFYVNKWSMAKIAEKMGYSNPAAAKASKFKCLEKVREKAKLLFIQLSGGEIKHG